MKQAARLFSFATESKRKPRKRKHHGLLPRFQQAVIRIVSWLRSRQLSRAQRSLRLSETVSLGDKRFVAVLEYDTQRFLIAGTPQSVQLLTELHQVNFATALAEKPFTLPECQS